MSIIDVINQMCADAERENGPRLPLVPRFENGRYRDCKWCRGRGCVSCKIEADKEYARQFPNGPVPMATFNTNDPADVERMRKCVGIEALKKAFGEGGGGVAEIEENIQNNPPAQ